MPEPLSPAIEVTDLTVAYRDRPALWDVDLTVPRAVLLAVVGPNGAGKTTLIKSILGLIKPAAGRILVHGRPYEEQRRLVAYVPQRGSVDWDFPTSVLDVVMMGRYGALGWVRRPGRREREAALAALGQTGMADFAGRQISQLSGGQQQRVFLARALLSGGAILLLDEPFTGVDIPTQELFVSLFTDLTARGTAIIYATHDLDQARQNSDVVMLINRRLIAAGPPTEVFTSLTLQEAFGGKVIVIEAPGEGVREPAVTGSGMVRR